MLIPTEPRKKFAVLNACEFLFNYTPDFPLNCMDYFETFGVVVWTYSELAYVKNEPIDVIAKSLPSDAFLYLDKKEWVYYLLLNDTKPKKRQIFTMAHEIGHIELGHFIEFDVSNLNDKQRYILDVEANIFASNVLAPVNLIDFWNLKKPKDVAEKFNMSIRASQVRLANLDKDRQHINAINYHALNSLFFSQQGSSVDFEVDWSEHDSKVGFTTNYHMSC